MAWVRPWECRPPLRSVAWQLRNIHQDLTFQKHCRNRGFVSCVVQIEGLEATATPKRYLCAGTSTSEHFLARQCADCLVENTGIARPGRRRAWDYGRS